MDIIPIFKYLYLLGGVNALFFSLLIFMKKNKSVADRILAWWMIAFFLQLIIPFFYLQKQDWYIQYSGIELVVFTFHPIFLYSYVRALTAGLKSFQPVFMYYFLAIIPGVIILYAIQVPKEIKIRFLNGERIFSWPLVIGILSSLSFFEVFLFRCMQMLRKHKKKVLHIFSYRQNVDLYWLWRLTYGFVFIYSFAMTLTVIFFITQKPLLFVDYVFYALLSIFVFLIGFFGWQQGNIFNQIDIERTHDLKNPHENNERLSEEAEQLSKYMDAEKPYLDQSLSIQILADGVGMSVSTISRILNREFNQNFYEFVNSYRIAQFKDTIKTKQSQSYTLIAIAYDCGFNSKASFNRVFKEQTGMTPGEYKKMFQNN